mmetsp:Transcript_9313/g.32836  ORF Transcript_9313/g.32836 Transcript_9313/m.32836 type:complete len:303 (+) Transcript_9313:1785-2693(+)
MVAGVEFVRLPCCWEVPVGGPPFFWTTMFSSTSITAMSRGRSRPLQPASSRFHRALSKFAMPTVVSSRPNLSNCRMRRISLFFTTRSRPNPVTDAPTGAQKLDCFVFAKCLFFVPALVIARPSGTSGCFGGGSSNPRKGAEYACCSSSVSSWKIAAPGSNGGAWTTPAVDGRSAKEGERLLCRESAVQGLFGTGGGFGQICGSDGVDFAISTSCTVLTSLMAGVEAVLREGYARLGPSFKRSCSFSRTSLTFSSLRASTTDAVVCSKKALCCLPSCSTSKSNAREESMAPKSCRRWPSSWNP